MRRGGPRWRGLIVLVAALGLLHGCSDGGSGAIEVEAGRDVPGDPSDARLEDRATDDLGRGDALADTDGVDLGSRDADDGDGDGDGDDAPGDLGGDPFAEIDAAISPAERVVVAGDSWSTGAVQPLRNALDEWEYPDVVITWETTALAGSQAREWVANHEGKLDALTAALDAEPPAEILLLFLGGNDFNFELSEHGWSQDRRDDTIDAIEDDLQALVDGALAGRPHLTVVLVDYSYFNYPKMQVVYGFDIAPNLADFNMAYVEMGRRKRAIAARTVGCEYAHNFGILQHTLGDEQRVYPVEPYVVPAYEPGFFNAPGHAPDYEPFPGGEPAFPAPDPALFDGLHATDDAMRIILDNVRDQGLGSLLDGRRWLSE